MQIIKTAIRLLFFILPVLVHAQTTYLQQGSKEYQFIDRLEIKQQQNSDLNFSSLKPYSRKAIVKESEYLDSARLAPSDSASQGRFRKWADLKLTPIDEYNLHSLLMNNTEWVNGPRPDFLSSKPILKTFYKTKVNMIEVKTNDFFLAVNPVIQFQEAKETGSGEIGFLNSRGITARGMIGNRVGFSTFLTDNQERGPSFFQSRIRNYNAVPGVGFYKPFKSNGVDYFDARGYVTFNAAKYIDFQFGYDKNFIGNGYRSMFLSDYGNSYLFLKINTRVWKFNYQNLFMELMPQFVKTGDDLLSRKYAAMHHLSMNVTKWLNLGIFESIIFGRKDHFDFQYLNPIIFLRYVEGNVGSPDKAHVGFDFKANAARKFQFYGQFLLDEFILKELLKHDGFWANKWALQGGMKYVDAFGINNLDLQLEANVVRPFTYSHYDSVTNYTHYNQLLADPLGANFHEYIAILKYQPAPKWYINARAIYYDQGLDSAGQNFGSNPFRNYTTRLRDYGYRIGSGIKAKTLNGMIGVAYELKENLYIETSVLYRTSKNPNQTSSLNSTLFSLGVRLNMFRREYDF